MAGVDRLLEDAVRTSWCEAAAAAAVVGAGGGCTATIRVSR